MLKDIAIYGAGGFGREVACLIRYINAQSPVWNIVGFFDDGKEEGTTTEYGRVLGGIDRLNAWNKPLDLVIAIGEGKVVRSIVEKVTNPKISFPNIIHPNFFIDDHNNFTIGKGNIIQWGCYVSCNVSFGDFNIFDGSVVFGHDIQVGDYNTFMPGSRISGQVNIGDCNFFGVGSIVLQQLKIGNNVRLGAGSILMTRPKEGYLYLGNPARKTVF